MTKCFNVSQKTIMISEVKLDTYSSGRDCDVHEPYFETACEDGFEPDKHKCNLIINCKTLPPGTTITVKVPICPTCGKPSDMNIEMIKGKHDFNGYKEKCECGFDWKFFYETIYS